MHILLHSAGPIILGNSHARTTKNTTKTKQKSTIIVTIVMAKE
jgi:hypothetical protein